MPRNGPRKDQETGHNTLFSVLECPSSEKPAFVCCKIGTLEFFKGGLKGSASVITRCLSASLTKSSEFEGSE